MTTVDAMAMKRQEIARPLLLAGLLALGAGTVLAVAVFWLVAVADQCLWNDANLCSIVVRHDGIPLRVLGGNTPRTYYTLDGKEVPVTRTTQWIDGTHLALPRADAWQSSFMSWRRRLVWMHNVGDGEGELWYFFHDGKRDGNCYFVCFHRKTKQCLGYLGVNGFQEDEPSAQERIPYDLRTYFSSYVGREDGKASLISGDRLMEIDFRKRTVRTLMTADQILAQGLHSVPRAVPPPEDPAENWPRISCYAVRLPDRVILLEPKKRTQRTFALPAEVRDRSFTFYQLRPDLALLIRFRRIMAWNHWDLDWIDPAGSIVRHEEVASPPWSVFHRPSREPWVVALAVSSPLLTVPLAPLSGTDTDPWPGYSPAYMAGLPNAWAPCTLAVIFAIWLAWLCYRRQKRYAQPWTAAWMVFILLGGLPAWLAYRWHRRWPVLAACPACGQLAPRDRLHCAHCGAEFPVPQAKGIEVFAA